MFEIDFFDNSLAMSVYAWISLCLVALQIEVVAYIAKRMPQRLPASIVRRAL